MSINMTLLITLLIIKYHYCNRLFQYTSQQRRLRQNLEFHSIFKYYSHSSIWNIYS